MRACHGCYGRTRMAAVADVLVGGSCHNPAHARDRHGGSAIHLSRLEVGRGEQSVRFSAWLVDEWEGTPTNVAPDEHDEIRWFWPEELPPLIHEPVRTALVEAMRGACG